MQEEDKNTLSFEGRLNLDKQAAELVVSSFPVCDRLPFYIMLGKHAVEKHIPDGVGMDRKLARLRYFSMPDGTPDALNANRTVFAFEDPNEVAALQTLCRLSVLMLNDLSDKQLHKYPGSDGLEAAKRMRKDDVRMANAIYHIAEELLDECAVAEKPRSDNYDLN